VRAAAVREEVAGENERARRDTVRSEYRLDLQCPACRADLDGALFLESGHCTGSARCRRCSWELRQERGVWNALPAKRRTYYEQFIREYEIVRASEGRGSEDSSFYFALPHKDLTGRNPWQWKIRSRSFRYIEREILPDLEKRLNRPLVVLDLGAGNGWLSYRLALRGHFPVAVDLLTNEFDGLTAASHYAKKLPRLFPRFRAELDRLPFADDQCDCVIFNASFHYSEDYSRTVGEAIRCLRGGGASVIADSPWYSREEFGQTMVQERRRDFRQRFGFPSDGLASLEYLTDERLSALATRFGIHWKIHRPWYGFRWAMRPWMAKWKGRREPAAFRIYTAQLRKA
jgi:SAM-dependent methyltransferase